MHAARRIGWKHLVPVLLGHAGSGSLIFAFTGSWRVAFGVIYGPFAGAVARDWQSCCAENSWGLARYALCGIAVAFVAQLLLPSRGLFLRAVRVALWWSGSIGWFFAALPSYGHAFE